MKTIMSGAILLAVFFVSIPVPAQYSKPVYISLPGPGNIQHLAYVVGKEKKFYEEMGIANPQIVVLRGNAVNVPGPRFRDRPFFLSVRSGHADDVSR